ncbi:hypothetical protein BKG96_00435 [Rodentibacter caecimuris]|uniref:Excalibur calcium-binding domain-containing protein n=1 Tax=Rodentibacter caecimuris TaxID=1796644 RepID=A0A1V3KQI0_9PAST|nr:excalibur calcium-binding domain-containing protein [Rodentibacter heylii]OOF54760.1 hypothetical protein BKK56_08120 [Rodentibacter genomosp. 2]OOF79929.1 hypothetical protein BKG96_00435 [Rodentibacter heylii]
MKKILLGVLLFALSYDSLAARVRCSDFATQDEAQQYMRENGANYLDRDKDGEACECLPGGSKYGSSVCRR